MVTIDMINQRHNYASSAEEEAIGHVYLPTAMLTQGARLMAAGVDVKFHDENIEKADLTGEHVAIGLLGHPYIPDAIRKQKEVKDEYPDANVYLGGQVISQLPKNQFHRLFGEDALNGNDSEVLEVLVDDPFAIVGQSVLDAPEETSLIPAYEALGDEVLKQYLTQENEDGELVGREFSFYVSQGCTKGCSFCTADRNRPGQPTVGEKYRNQDIMKHELEYLIQKQKSFGVDELNIYMSNLDVFQTPDELHTFAKNVIDLREKYEGFEINLRGLACVDSFLSLRDERTEVLDDLVKAGFHTVGYGVDGMTPAVWKKIGKAQNKSAEQCLEAIRPSAEDFGLVPESLMVFGHNEADSEDSLRLAYEFCLAMQENYGAISRPHVTKDFAPGNSGWTGGKDEALYASRVEMMLENPELFQCLDFLALPTELTHADPDLRKNATKYFLKICEIEGSTSIPIEPVLPGMTAEEIAGVRKRNEGRFDR